MHSSRSTAKTVAQGASIVLAAATLAITGCNKSSFTSTDVARETVPETLSDVQMVFVKLSDQNLMAFGATKGILRVFKTSEGYAESGGKFDLVVISGSKDASSSNRYLEISYLQALALLDGNWIKAQEAAILQASTRTNSLPQDLIQRTFEPLTTPKAHAPGTLYGETFTDGPCQLVYPGHELLHRVSEIQLAGGEISRAHDYEVREKSLSAAVENAKSDKERQAASMALEGLKIRRTIMLGLTKVSAQIFTSTGEEGNKSLIPSLSTPGEKDFISRKVTNVTSNLASQGSILFPRHAPVYLKMPDEQNLLKICQVGEEIQFYKTASGYGVTGIGGGIHVPRVGSLGGGLEKPTGNVFSEISARELAVYFDGKLDRILEAVDRQARVTSYTVQPHLVRDMLSKI